MADEKETLSQRIARQKAQRLAGRDAPTKPEDWDPLVKAAKKLGDSKFLKNHNKRFNEENLNEISRAAVHDYLEKSKKEYQSNSDQNFKLGRSLDNKWDQKKYKKAVDHGKTANKRAHGIKNAEAKLDGTAKVKATKDRLPYHEFIAGRKLRKPRNPRMSQVKESKDWKAGDIASHYMKKGKLPSGVVHHDMSHDFKQAVYNTAKNYDHGLERSVHATRVAMLNKHLKLQEETINELSNKTLDKYRDSAVKDLHPQTMKLLKDPSKKQDKKVGNRIEGIRKAAMRIKYRTNESEELNEISKDTINSYVSKVKKQRNKLNKYVDGLNSSGNAGNWMYKKVDDVKAKRNKGMKLARKKLKEDTINELSKEKLANYVRRAKDDLVARTYDDDSKEANKDRKKFYKKKVQRHDGIDRALHRLTREGIDWSNERPKRKSVKYHFKKGERATLNKPGHEWHGKSGTIHRGKPRRHGDEPYAWGPDDHKLQGGYFSRHELKKIKEETINELSKETLKSYLEKSTKSSKKLASTPGIFPKNKGSNKEKSWFKTPERRQFRNRLLGQERAHERLKGKMMTKPFGDYKRYTAEETLNEISKETLTRYRDASKRFSRETDKDRRGNYPKHVQMSLRTNKDHDKLELKKFNRKMGEVKADERISGTYRPRPKDEKDGDSKYYASTKYRQHYGRKEKPYHAEETTSSINNILQEKFIIEISKKKLEKYLPKAIENHGHHNFAARYADDEERKYHRKEEQKRKKGINRAVLSLDKKKD